MSREALDSSNVYDFLCSRASNVEMEGLVMGLQIENRRLIADLNERFKAGLTKIWEKLKKESDKLVSIECLLLFRDWF